MFGHLSFLFKDTDWDALLHEQSFHPKHTFKGLIKAQLICFYHSCTYSQDIEEATYIIFNALLPHGYSESEYIKQDDTQTPLIPLVMSYSSSVTRLRNMVAQNLQQSCLYCPQLQSFHLITALSRS